MNQKEMLINELATLLKQKGFKKNRQTWHKDKGELVIVFNIQNSQWSVDDYYLNLGVFIKSLEECQFTLNNCHIIERVKVKNEEKYLDATQVSKAVDLWDEWYGTIEMLKEKALKRKLPLQTSTRAISFLTTI